MLAFVRSHIIFSMKIYLKGPYERAEKYVTRNITRKVKKIYK